MNAPARKLIHNPPSVAHVELTISVCDKVRVVEAEVTYLLISPFAGSRETPEEKESVEILAVRVGNLGDIQSVLSEAQLDAIAGQILEER